MNTQPRHPKCRALPVEPHPDIHFSAMIPRRGRKSKIFLSVVIPVVKATFVPFSATGGNPANAGVARLCGVSPHPIPDTTTALPNQARYQLRYTRIANLFYQTSAADASRKCERAGHGPALCALPPLQHPQQSSLQDLSSGGDQLCLDLGLTALGLALGFGLFLFRFALRLAQLCVL